jgi:hypothetical protein
MSRSGYTDDCENLGLWRGAVAASIRGKRGQAFLRDALAALDAMPVKELIPHHLQAEGSFCLLGAVAAAKSIDYNQLNAADPDDFDTYAAAAMFGIAQPMAAEIVYENDEHPPRWNIADQQYILETPAQRWQRMRDWVASKITAPSSIEVAK